MDKKETLTTKQQLIMVMSCNLMCTQMLARGQLSVAVASIRLVSPGDSVTLCTSKVLSHPPTNCRHHSHPLRLSSLRLRLPVCLQCRLQTTSLLCQLRSSRRVSPSPQQLWSAGFFSVTGPAIWNWLPDSLRDPAIKRSLKTFIFPA